MSESKRILLTGATGKAGQVFINRVLNALPLGGEQLDELRASVLLGGTEYLCEVGSELGLMRHLHSFTSPGLRDHLARVGNLPASGGEGVVRRVGRGA